MQKKKGLKITLYIIVPILLLVAGFVYVKAVFFTPKEIPAYSFSGYVYADGLPLEGVTISCEEGTAITSDRGYYTITGVKDVVSVTASKEGYFVENNLKYASENNNQIDFECYKYFDKYGVVENNGNLISNAIVKANSKAGSYTTTTNLFGEFYLPKLAGDVTIEVISDTTQFFTQSFDITQEKLVLNGSTTISGKLKLDKSASINDFELKLNGESISITNDFAFEISEVSCGDVLTLCSDKFYIENNEVKITEEKQEITFNCLKFYDVNLSFASGETSLSNTEICVNGDKTYIATNNEFSLNNLYGENILSFTNDYFEFEDIKVTTSESFDVVGYFTLDGMVTSDDNLKSLKVSHNGQEYIAENGKFSVDGCQLDDELYLSSDGYYIDECVVSLSSNKLVVNKEKLYSLKMSIAYKSEPLDLLATISGNEYEVVDGYFKLDGLHGSKEISLNLDGYVFEDFTCDYINNDFIIEPYKLYSLKGVVKSGDIILSNAEVLLNNEVISLNDLGEFQVDNLYLDGSLQVNCDGYDSVIVEFDVNNNDVVINLTYSVDGNVVCGESGVAGVLVSGNDVATTTNKNGYFKLDGLIGKNELTFNKDFYSFEKLNVSKNATLDINATYSIVGSVETGEGLLENFKIVLISLTNGNKLTTTTNNDGEYVFENLVGEYILAYDESTDLSLKPLSYDIEKGGEYNFADKGYAFSGVITTGGKAVADVIVRAGDAETVTNANGEYKFDLLTKPCVLNLSKEGYVFENNNLQVNDQFDLREDVNFECSYTVSGVVRSGSINLDNAIVSIQDQITTTINGKFEISGIIGNATLSVQLDGYTFDSDIDIDGYKTLDINGYYSTTIYTCTGDVSIAGAVVSFNGNNYSTNESGRVNIAKVYGGDTYAITKEGYNFSTYTFGEYLEVNKVDVTYSISGEVVNAGVGIVGAMITLGELETTTDNYGKFKINNVRGENTLIITKENFEFKEYIINSPIELDVVAMFKVTGYVLVDSIPLAGVSVTISNKQTTTNNAGYFELTQIDEAGEIILEKTGYQFGDVITVNTNKSVTIFATYSVSGVVTTGNIKIAGARIISSNGQETISDMNGYYQLTGLDRVVSIEVITENYDSKTLNNISSYSDNLNCNLTYSVVLNFTGEYKNVRIGVNNIYKEYSASQVILSELSGENVITYNKNGYTFVEDVTGSVVGYEVRNITISLVYTVTGKVVTTSGYAIPNAIVSAGGKKTTTNASGEYILDGLSNKLTIKASLESEDCLFEVEGAKQVSYETTCNLTLSDNQYFYYLTMLGYENLRKSHAYLVVGEGTVTPNTSMSGPQSVRVIYRKDGSGKRLSQNLNYGEEINILGIGVDPRVAFLSYYDTVSGQIMYKRAEGGDINSNKIASYNKYSWQTNVNDPFTYLNTFGTKPDGFYPYTSLLNSTDKKKTSGEYSGDTVSSIKNISKSGNDYTFTIVLNTGINETTSYYKKQMSYMVPEQTCKGFSKIELKYTISTDGKLKNTIITEKYTVESMSVTVDTDAVINYSYNMYNEGDSAIVNIDTSDNGVARALSLEGVALASISNINLMSYKRREEV